MSKATYFLGVVAAGFVMPATQSYWAFGLAIAAFLLGYVAGLSYE